MVLYKKKDVRIFTEVDVGSKIRKVYVEETSPFDRPLNGSSFSIGNNLKNWNNTTLLNLVVFLGWEIGFSSPECALELLGDLSEVSGWHMQIIEYFKWREEAYTKFKKVL